MTCSCRNTGQLYTVVCINSRKMQGNWPIAGTANVKARVDVNFGRDNQQYIMQPPRRPYELDLGGRWPAGACPIAGSSVAPPTTVATVIVRSFPTSDARPANPVAWPAGASHSHPTVPDHLRRAVDACLPCPRSCPFHTRESTLALLCWS